MRGDRLRLLAGRFFGFLRIPRKITGKAAYVLVEALMRSVWRLQRCDGQKPVKLGIGALALFAAVGSAQGGFIEFNDKGDCHEKADLLCCNGPRGR